VNMSEREHEFTFAKKYGFLSNRLQT